MRVIRIAMLCAGLVLAASAAEAATKIVLEGEASPGGNGAFTGFSVRRHLTETGKLFFFGTTDATPPVGATTAGCIFRYDVDGSNGTAVLCNGDSVSLPGGDFWTEVGTDLDVNGSGDLVFTGVYRDTMGADQFSTFHLSSIGALTDLGVWDGEVQVNDANDVLIGGLDLGITSPGSPVTTILIEDQALPDDPSIFAADSWGAVGPSGQVAVSVRATPVPSGPPFTDWIIYLWDSGVFTRIGANTFGPFTPSGADVVIPHFTPGGRLLAIVDDGFFSDGIVEWDGASWEPVVLPRPDELIGAGAFPVDSAGLSRIAGWGLLDGTFGPWCMVLGTGTAARTRPILVGDVLTEGTVASLSPAAISTTHWAVEVTLAGGSETKGVYVGRTNKVPSLAAPPAVLLGVLIGIAGVWRLANARGPR